MWSGTPALGIQSGLLFEAWSPTLDPERRNAPLLRLWQLGVPEWPEQEDWALLPLQLLERLADLRVVAQVVAAEQHQHLMDGHLSRRTVGEVLLDR